MKSRVGHLIAVLLALLTGAGWLSAQEGRSAALKGEPKLSLEVARTPDFGGRQHGGPLAQGAWLVVNLQFQLDGKGKWLDGLEVTYRVMVTGRDRTADRRLLLERTVTYADVELGRRCNTAVYVRPSFFLRHFNGRPDPRRVSCHVEIRHNGRRLGTVRQNGHGVPEDWYKTRGKFDGDALMLKRETPFAFLDYDYFLYEIVDQS